jgi:predicted phosphodiesterase
MKYAVLTDTHIGARNSSPLFTRHIRRFFTEVFWPKVDAEGVEAILHVGDVFESGRTLSMEALATFNDVVLTEVQKRKLPIYLIVGNHDMPFRDHAVPNMVRELCWTHKEITVVDEPTEVDNLLLLPWPTPDLHEKTVEWAKTSSAKYVFGHLDITGARMNGNRVSEGGIAPKLFRRFKHVYSGHFHCRSTMANITYLSNPIDLTWSEIGWHGFWLFESKTGRMDEVETPWRVHNLITADTALADSYHDKLVRIEYAGKVPQAAVDRARSTGAADVRTIDITPPDDMQGEPEAGPLPATRVLIRDYVMGLKEDSRVPRGKLADLLEKVYDMAVQQGEAS